jgi:Pilus assembly protein, PilO
VEDAAMSGPQRVATVAPTPTRSTLAAQHEVTVARRSVLAQVTQGARAMVPYANYAAQRLGKLGIIGVALCVFSAVAVVSTNSPLREQLAGDSAALEQLASTPERATQAAAATPQAQFQTFLEELPTRDDLPALMGQIVAASAATGVDLEEGHYELVAAGKAGHIARYRLSFPVMGSYPQVRGFIDQALIAVPAMSLDGLSLERGDIADRVVNAELDFAVFVRTGL